MDKSKYKSTRATDTEIVVRALKGFNVALLGKLRLGIDAYGTLSFGDNATQKVRVDALRSGIAIEKMKAMWKSQAHTKASDMGPYMQKSTDKFKELTTIESAWTYANQGKLVFFWTSDHVSIAHPTVEGDMLIRNAGGKDYKFGKVVQAGGFNGLMNLNKAWRSERFPEIKVYLYLGE
jgi:hypothetical protein